ncbi:hypothetical protein HanXRQr2_Chr10g0443361 [Helianthus annuus]|uniref:Uncharacterized protein n=1 Tax=Helianthus annuus TaxID=4232 RepID=A0A9K3N4I3_HELAN|nr:hypothetical protein HanXRQr2_Chr10g0443361 [Helianthus annuus]
MRAIHLPLMWGSFFRSFYQSNTLNLYYTKLAGISFLSITNSLANSMPYLNEQYFYFDPLWIHSTSVIYLILPPEVEVYIYL